MGEQKQNIFFNLLEIINSDENYYDNNLYDLFDNELDFTPKIGKMKDFSEYFGSPFESSTNKELIKLFPDFIYLRDSIDDGNSYYRSIGFLYLEKIVDKIKWDENNKHLNEKIYKSKFAKLIKKLHKNKLKLIKCESFKMNFDFNYPIFEGIMTNFKKIHENEQPNNKIKTIYLKNSNQKYNNNEGFIHILEKLLKDTDFLRKILVKNFTKILFHKLAINKLEINSIKNKDNNCEILKKISINKYLIHIFNKNKVFDIAFIVLMRSIMYKSYQKNKINMNYYEMFLKKDELISKNICNFGEEPKINEITYLLCEKIKKNIIIYNLIKNNHGNSLESTNYESKLKETKSKKMIILLKIGRNYKCLYENKNDKYNLIYELKNKCDKCLKKKVNNNLFRSSECFHKFCFCCLRKKFKKHKQLEILFCSVCNKLKQNYNKLHHLKTGRDIILSSHDIIKKWLKKIKKKIED